MTDFTRPWPRSRRGRRRRRARSRFRRVLSSRTRQSQHRQNNLIHSRQRNRRRASLEVAALRVSAFVRVGLGQLGHDEQRGAEKVSVRGSGCRAVILVDTRFGDEVARGANGRAGAVGCRDRALDSEVAGPL